MPRKNLDSVLVRLQKRTHGRDVAAFYTEIGPRLMAKIAKVTGLAPEDL